MWHQIDWVSRSTFLLLLLMSVSCWYVALVKFFQQRRILNEARELQETHQDILTAIDRLPWQSPFHALAAQVREASLQVKQTHGLEIDGWVGQALGAVLQQCAAQQQAGMTLLATVGSTSPFVGLFGTVWGIFHALTAISQSGQATLAQVAGPVGEALVMTALGLAVAVPAVFAYNLLLRRNRVVDDAMRQSANRIHAASVIKHLNEVPRLMANRS